MIINFRNSIVLLSSLSIATAVEFHPVELLKAGGNAIATESPGYAAPCWADINGDGMQDLLVGQFNGGKIKVYKGQADGKLAAGEWLKASGEVAEIPGVW